MEQEPSPVTQYAVSAISLRPYQLLCLVCGLGEARSDPAARAAFESLNREPFWSAKRAFLGRVLEAIRRQPDIPVVLRCNEGGVYSFQDPGTKDDSPEGAEFNRKRDLDILAKLDLAPGAVLPARHLLYRAQNHLKTVRGTCGYGEASSCAWKGCPKANSGFYERGNQVNIDEYIPFVSDGERAEVKKRSVSAMDTASAIRIRPHLLMCAVCQYGMGIRPPFEADNLPEFLQLVLGKPQTLVTLVNGADGMMCGPCKRRAADTGACVNVGGTGGLSNELRDLNVLQLLGLGYGSTLKAGELYRLLFERIPSSKATCTKDNARISVWGDCCSDLKEGNASYVKGQAEFKKLGFV
ncbi:MAG: hypothetical protein ACOYMV_09180 [Verrucomicrobiia bacterium]